MTKESAKRISILGEDEPKKGEPLTVRRLSLTEYYFEEQDTYIIIISPTSFLIEVIVSNSVDNNSQKATAQVSEYFYHDSLSDTYYLFKLEDGELVVMEVQE